MFKSHFGHCGLPVSHSLFCGKWKRWHPRNALFKAKPDSPLNAAREERILKKPLLRVIEPLGDKYLNLLFVIILDTHTANICQMHHSARVIVVDSSVDCINLFEASSQLEICSHVL